MKISCPHCNQSLEGDETLIDQYVKCPSCTKYFMVNPPLEKACPFCAETIKYSATRCRYCQADLTGDMLKNGPTEVELTSKKYKKQILQGLIITIIGFVCSFLVSMFSTVNKRTENESLTIFLGVLMIFFIICTIFGIVRLIFGKYRAWWHNG